MKPIDVAIDDYMHVIARTRPWTMKREAELLEAFSDWLYEQPTRNVMLHDLANEHIRQYAATTNLSPAAQDELLIVLNNMYHWSAQQGWSESNPFHGSVS